jgi:hypothetical protein
MGDFLIEFFEQFVREIIPTFLKVIGAGIKWILYLGKISYSNIFKEEWNTRIGLGIIIIVISTIIYSS